MKLVHAADLHLDSPLRGLERYEGAPVTEIRDATRRALQQLVRLCIDERAALLLLAGDLYDGDWQDYSTGLFFAAQMSLLREAGVKVALIRGNHDAASKITRNLRLPANVHELPCKKPGSVVFEELGVVVHGQGFETPAVHDDLARGYPAPVPGALNLGLLHTALGGAPGHQPYAPCSLETLRDRGYDYWALGHVHQRAVLSTDPWVVYPGNLQGRHARETGAKGATLVDVVDGRVASVEARALDVVRWTICEVDAAAEADADGVLDQACRAVESAVELADGRLVAARVVVGGRSRAYAALRRDPESWAQSLRGQVADACGAAAWVEKVRITTSDVVDVEGLRERDDAVGQLARRVHELRADAASLAELAASLDELWQKLPEPLKNGDDAVDLAECVQAGLDSIEYSVLPRLVARGDA